MNNQLLIQEMVNQDRRARDWAGLHRNGSIGRPEMRVVMSEIGISAAVGRALVRAGRFLQGESISRPAQLGARSAS